MLTAWFVDRFAATWSAPAVTGRRRSRPLRRRPPIRPRRGRRVVLPYLAGRRTPVYDPGATGALLGLRLGHTRGDLYRAFLEGTASACASPGRGPPVGRGRRPGRRGRRTASPLWRQVVSDVTGLRQEVVAAHHGAAAGAAVLAAVGTSGDHERGAAHAGIAQVSVTRTVTPAEDLKPLYDRRFELYLDAYERTRPIIAGLAAPAPTTGA